MRPEDRESFQQELLSLVKTLESGILALEERGDGEQLGQVFRCAHNIKSAAGMLGLESASGAAHALEEQLDALRRGKQAVDAPAITQLLAGVDRLLSALCVERAPTPETEQTFEPSVSQTLAVSVRRVDALIELSTELSIAMIGMEKLWEMREGATEDRAQAAFATLRRLTSRLHEAVTMIRLVPMAPTFALVRRYVRDQALRLGKPTEVVLRGEQTEIDKSIADRLLDPLKHLLRNALDHGIEPPDEREQKGKPRRGRLILEARQEHGQVVLDMSDDGRGLDFGRIREVAIARGLLHPDAEPSDAELAKLIFTPGFSTSAEVGALSGRGVGLDVVQRNIAELGGDVRVHSRPGAGVTFTLSVPLTLVVIEGLVVRSGTERLIVPLDLVRSIVRLEKEGVIHLPGGEKLLRWQDDTLPLVRLDELLGLGSPSQGESIPPLSVIVSTPNGLLGLGVDRVLSEEAVLLKGLHRALRIGDGILAAAVMGDGHVALVLDISALCERLSGGTKAAQPSTVASRAALLA